jgi:dTDP-glucose 4,6-dehydratase
MNRVSCGSRESAGAPPTLQLPEDTVRVVVTGGAGFIGSALVRRLLACGDHVLNIDKLTYAGSLDTVAAVSALPNYTLLRADVADGATMAHAVADFAPDAVFHLAAETHVDRSIESPDEFIQTDVFGTLVLLEAAHAAGIRHLQVSTDEVYGSIPEGSFTEATPIDPSSPYSAAKAGGDLMVTAFQRTFGADALIARGSNNFGPRQYPEKLIPLCILNALAGDPLPVYGDGMQVRNWLWADDFARATDLVLARGEAGQAYNVGGPDELPNIEVVKAILELTGRDESLIAYVDDRPGHDRRYSLSSEKLRSDLGWAPEVRFRDGLERTVAWYRDNEAWWGPIRSGDYRAYYERQYGRALG